MTIDDEFGHEEQYKALLNLLQDDNQPIPASIHIHDWGNGQAILNKVISQINGQIIQLDPLTCPTTQILFSRLYTGFHNNSDHTLPGSSMPKNVLGDGSLDAMLHALDGEAQKNKSSRFIIVIKRAERMRDVWSEETVNVLFNLSKRLCLQGKLSLITISRLSISHFRSSKAPGSHFVPFDTIVIRFGRMEKEEVLQQFRKGFDGLINQIDLPENVSINQLSAIYETYSSFAYDAFAAEVRDLNELRLLTSCVWYPFIQPVLDGSISVSKIQLLLVRSSSLFRHALEYLHTRRMNPNEWIEGSLKQLNMTKTSKQVTSFTSLQSRSLLTSIVLISAFLASYNPARLDVRYFVRDESAIVSQSIRASDGKMKKRKRGGALKKTLSKRRAGRKFSGVDGVSEILLSRQELLGPKTFTLDRLMNIVQSLAIEIAPDLKGKNFMKSLSSNENSIEFLQEFQEEWEIRSKGISIFESLNELIKLGLIVRTSAIDRLDVTTILRVNTGRETVVELAKSVNLNLEEWIHG